MLLTDACDAETCTDIEADIALASEFKLVMLIAAETPEADSEVIDVVELLLEDLCGI